MWMSLLFGEIATTARRGRASGRRGARAREIARVRGAPIAWNIGARAEMRTRALLRS
jgi:hypothetical protein